MKINVIFYSLYGHIWKMAEAIAAGAKEVAGAQVKLYQVAETLPPDLVAKLGGSESKKQFSHIPVATLDPLAEADAVIFGTPTRYGNMCAQMRAYLDGTGSFWAKDALVGKVGSVFTSSQTQHGGQESTILSFHITLLHLGMIIVGLPYSEKKQMIGSEISGGSPYGASTIAGPDGKRMPSENELAMARFQGKHVASIAKRLAG
jgi:NAD(P)H dehydrogenase (quinone)